MKYQFGLYMCCLIYTVILSDNQLTTDINGVINTVAGTGTSGYNGDNIQATSAHLKNPSNIYVTSNNEILIVDTNNNRIRFVSTDGNISTLAGTGAAGYNYDNVQATIANLNYPYGVYVTLSNTLYIADTYNNRIRMVSPNGIISTIAGTGTSGYNYDNIQATSANLYYPYSIYVTQSNTVYVADINNHRIRVISPNGIISTVAGTGVAWYNGDNIPATSASLCRPIGFFITSVSTLIYIADTGNNRIRLVSIDGIISTVAGTGSSGYNGDNIQATSAALYYPYSIYITSSNMLYISDTYNNRIRVVFPNGIISSVVCTGNNAGYNKTTSIILNHPRSLHIVSTLQFGGIIYIADSGSNRVIRIYTGINV